MSGHGLTLRRGRDGKLELRRFLSRQHLIPSAHRRPAPRPRASHSIELHYLHVPPVSYRYSYNSIVETEVRDAIDANLSIFSYGRKVERAPRRFDQAGGTVPFGMDYSRANTLRL